mgnify:CR=1 FL=1
MTYTKSCCDAAKATVQLSVPNNMRTSTHVSIVLWRDLLCVCMVSMHGVCMVSMHATNVVARAITTGAASVCWVLKSPDGCMDDEPGSMPACARVGREQM